MLDEQLDNEKVVVQFRERLHKRLDELGVGKNGLAHLFDEMDVSDKGALSFKDLRAVLFTLNFHVSQVQTTTCTKTNSRERRVQRQLVD